MLQKLDNEEAWAQQIVYWRQHLDIAIDQMFGVKLTEEQAVVAREIGNCDEGGIFATRGLGKTYMAAVIAAALCVLYPESKGLVFSGTVAQATLTLEKLNELTDTHPFLANELKQVGNNSKKFISITKGIGGSCTFKNRSTIESLSIDSARGRRATFVIVDELLELNKTLIDSTVSPILNFKREICVRYGFDAEHTKIILMSSAFSAQNSNYEYVSSMLNEMRKGNRKSFVCALPYTAAIRSGLTAESFFEGEKRRLSEEIFNMEYRCWFCGNTKDAVFKYTDIENCRTLKAVETSQTKGTKSHYIISVDLATSSSTVSDNTVFTVLKFSETKDGTFFVQVPYIRSYNGKKLDYIATELRKLYHLKFPLTEKIIYDARGLGDAFSRFLDQPWTNGSNEYQALLTDKEVHNGILHPINATNTYNVRLVTVLKLLMEQQRIELPVHASIIKQLEAENVLSFDDEQEEDNIPKKKLTQEERAIYYEADALETEMGYVREMRSASGNIQYDTTNIRFHKDRYSSLAMGTEYIISLEEKKTKYGRIYEHSTIGISGSVDDADGWGEGSLGGGFFVDTNFLF